MAWLVLVLSGVLEAVWATALGRSEGFSKIGPSIVFVVSLVASMGGLAYAMRTLPIGTSYAVWVGIGASLTVAYAMITGTEPFSLVKAALLVVLYEVMYRLCYVRVWTCVQTAPRREATRPPASIEQTVHQTSLV